MATRILLVEDDPNFGDVLRSYLELYGYEVTWATNGSAGATAFKPDVFNLCIFDVMMPKKDGFTLAQEVRSIDANVPILFVTAKTMKEDVIKGFKAGADDYITKPFNSDEFILRVQALLKRAKGMPQLTGKENETEFKIGKYYYNSLKRTLTYPSGIVKNLSPKEADLLRLLALNLNDMTSRSDMLNKVWGEDNYFTARSMDVFLTKIRQFFKEDERIKLVNIHGTGYALKVEV